MGADTDTSMNTGAPNIIYILGDDHRSDYLGYRDHPVLRTPNLDELAREGTAFHNAFCTSPACTPSRTCHYLGQWERRHGVNFNSGSAVAESAWERSFPMVLKRAGYYLGWVGKNHVPAGEGGYAGNYFETVFDYWYGNHGHSGFYPKEQAHGGAIYKNARADTQVEVFEEGAMNFLDPDPRFLSYAAAPDPGRPLPRRPEDKPFCLCVTFNLPHGVGTGNMQLRPSDDDLYRGAYRGDQHRLPLPKSYMNFDQAYANPRIPRDVYSGLYISQYDYVKAPHFLRERQVRTCQTVSGIDRFLGRLREKLEALNLADNTIIVFSTDHGLHHGEHGLGGKCFLYEEDLRIPLVVYDPRLPKEQRGNRREEMVAVPDLAPTVLELAGQPVPATMQGTSLVPLLGAAPPATAPGYAALAAAAQSPGAPGAAAQGRRPWREYLFTEQLMDIQNYPRSESVRSAEWKYIRYFKRTEDPKQAALPFRGTLDDYIACLDSPLNGERPVYEELYHLAEDPLELTNRAADPAYAAALEDMRSRIVPMGKDAKGPPGPPATVPTTMRL